LRNALSRAGCIDANTRAINAWTQVLDDSVRAAVAPVGIDVHRKMLADAVADVAVDGDFQFERQKVGTTQRRRVEQFIGMPERHEKIHP